MNVALQHDQAHGDFQYTDINGRRRVRENNRHSRQAVLLNGASEHKQLGRLSLVMSGHRSHRGEPGSSQFPTVDASSAEHRVTTGVSWDVNPHSGTSLPTTIHAEWTQRTYEFEDPDPSFMTDAGRFELDDWQTSGGAKVTWARSAWILPSLLLDGGVHAATTRSPAGTHREERRYTGAVVNQLDVFPAAKWTINVLNRIDVRNGRDAEWLPKTGVAYSGDRHWSSGLTLGRHFRDPSFDELFFRGSGISGNPGLRPESGWSTDAHFSYSPPTFPWSLHIAGYHQEFDRIILFVPLDAYRIQATDALSAKILGLETRLRLRWSSLMMEANYHYQRPRDGQNNPLPYRPTHRMNVRLEWVQDWGRIYGGSVNQSEVYSDIYGRRTLPRYSLFDMGLAAPSTRRV